MENSSSRKLRNRSVAVKDFPYSEDTLKQMKEAARMGLGLSAVQIGIMDRVFLIKDSKTSEPKFLCNPKQLFRLWVKPNKETCLSIGKQVYSVPRPELVVFTYTTTKGSLKLGVFTGVKAHIFDHELDHLNGICIDKKGVKVK